ncbi:MAG: hypothetical protein FWC27_04250 [Firmicutes bacterium]|nr:hypothetical protein [Bacillota bacterium]
MIIQPAIPTYQAMPMPAPCFSPPPVMMPPPDPWQQYSAPRQPAPPAPPAPPVPPPFTLPEPLPPLLPEFSSAPRPDFTPFADDYDRFCQDWYGQ